MKKRVLLIVVFIFIFQSALFGSTDENRVIVKGEIIEKKYNPDILKIRDEDGKDFNIIIPPKPKPAGADGGDEFLEAALAFGEEYVGHCKASGLSAIPHLEVGDPVEISGQLISEDTVEVCHSGQDYLDIIPFVKEIKVIGKYRQGERAFTKSWICHCGITTDDNKYYATSCISDGLRDPLRDPRGKRIKATLIKSELGRISESGYMGQMPVGEEFFPRCIPIKEYEILG